MKKTLDPAATDSPKETVAPKRRRGAEAAAKSPKSVADVVAAPSAALGPIPAELIARHAFEIFLERGGEHGRDVEDWLTAEHQLRVLEQEAASLTADLNDRSGN